MTDQQKKQKEIAVAFAWYFSASEDLDGHKIYDDWLLTEEGKRLSDDTESSEEVKWLRAAIETQYEAYEALAKETAADIKGLKQQLDRMEGNMKLTKEL